MNFVFFTLRDSLFILSHSRMLLSSLLIFSDNSSIFVFFGRSWVAKQTQRIYQICIISIYQIHAPKMSALHVHGACSCTVVYLGGSYASGALSAFVRVSRHKTLCMYQLSHCFLLVFVFCLINIFSSSSSSSWYSFGIRTGFMNIIYINDK